MTVSLDQTGSISSGIPPNVRCDPLTPVACLDHPATQSRKGLCGIGRLERRQSGRGMRGSANSEEGGGECTVSILSHRWLWSGENVLTILSFRICWACSRRTTPSNISTGKSVRLSEGLPAVIQVSSPRARSAFAAGPLATGAVTFWAKIVALHGR